MRHKILPGGYDAFALRNALKLLFMFVIMFVLLNVILAVVAGDSHIIQVVFLQKVHWLILIIGYIVGMRWFQERNIAKSLVYLVHPTAIGKTMDKDQLNLGNQYGVRKSERYGTRTNQLIPNNEIKSIKFKKNGIAVISKSFNFLTGNGKIFIPKELEAYEQVVQHCKILQQRLR